MFISCTRECGSGYVSGLSRTVLITEKTAVFAPMPTAITRIATTVNAGAFSSERTAKRTSCQMYSRETKEEASGVGRLVRLGWGIGSCESEAYPEWTRPGLER